MQPVPFERLRDYRAKTFHIILGQRLHSAEEALEFVNQRGFIFFWPIKDVLLPSLWTAVAGDRSVPDDHDDPGHITWGWKDDMLGKRRWYYGRVLRHRNTIISLEYLPYFYALSPNYGDFENDYLEQYDQGRLSMESKNVYESILREGPLDTIELRRKARLGGRENNTRFNRALDDLQIEFKIIPVGVAPVGAWHYAFIYELTTRHFPELATQARQLSELAARQKLMEGYLVSLGAVKENDIARLFHWNTQNLESTIQRLVENRVITTGVEIETQPGEWIAYKGLLYA